MASPEKGTRDSKLLKFCSKDGHPNFQFQKELGNDLFVVAVVASKPFRKEGSIGGNSKCKDSRFLVDTV